MVASEHWCHYWRGSGSNPLTHTGTKDVAAQISALSGTPPPTTQNREVLVKGEKCCTRPNSLTVFGLLVRCAGPIPEALGALTDLGTLFLNGNQLTGILRTRFHGVSGQDIRYTRQKLVVELYQIP